MKPSGIVMIYFNLEVNRLTKLTQTNPNLQALIFAQCSVAQHLLHQAGLVHHHALHLQDSTGPRHTVVGIPHTLAGKSLPSFSCLQWLIVATSQGLELVGTRRLELEAGGLAQVLSELGVAMY